MQVREFRNIPVEARNCLCDLTVSDCTVLLRLKRNFAPDQTTFECIRRQYSTAQERSIGLLDRLGNLLCVMTGTSTILYVPQ